MSSLSRLPVDLGLWRHKDGAERPALSAELLRMLCLPPGADPPTVAEFASWFQDPAQYETVRAALETGAPISTETWIRRADGALRRVRIAGLADRDTSGAVNGMAGAVVDLTEFEQIAERALANEELLSTFIDNAPAALAMFDAEMRYLRVSPRWVADYGLEGETLIGRTHYEVFPEISAAWKAIHRDCLDGSVRSSERDLFVRADGRKQWLSWEVRPWRTSAGKVGGLLMMTRDITELVMSMDAVETSERRLNLALEAAGMLVWQLDARTDELTVGGAVRVFFEHDHPTRNEVRALISPKESPWLREGFAKAREDRSVFRAEHELSPGKDGRPRWGLTVIEPLFDGGRYISAIGLLKDITEQKLEAQQLAAARAAAEAASRAKTEFLTTMSHEIRTPLNDVLGVAQALARTELAPRQREMVGLLLSAGRALGALVDDALEIGRIEAGALVIAQEPFDPAAVVREAAALFRPVAEEKGLAFSCEITCPSGLMLVGDALRLRQIVSNLVGNAVKYTHEGYVAVTLTVRPTAEGEAVLIEVRDSGVGFEQSQAAHLFERFVQGQAQAQGGAGLGLAIAKSLADAMGAQLSCLSAPSRGAAFTLNVTLPRAEPALLDDGEESHPFATQDHVRVEILVAEDNALNRKILTMLLSPFAARLTFVEHGLAACEELEHGHYDLVLMDVQMPVLDGLSAVRLIRAREALAGLPRTPIVCLTAQATPAQVAAALAAGADGHVAKPIEEAQLIAAIDRALSGEDELAAAEAR